MSKQRNPEMDWGFYAAIPRVVRTGYHEIDDGVDEKGEPKKKKLTPTHKWLYTCLKDLCGETGTCYRTIRTLAEETGISTGMLSESIRDLHTAGLIHAEKKRRSTNPKAKEVWHITIVDIWQANGKAHPTKRSQAEHPAKNVHAANNNVHVANNNASKRSCGEQQCSCGETEEESLSSITIEERSTEEESTPTVATPPAGANARTHSPASLSSEKKDVSSEKQLSNSRIASKATSPAHESVAIGETQQRGIREKAEFSYKSDKAAIHDLINAGRRGQKLIAKGEIIQENKAVIDLAQAYTLEQIRSIHTYLQTRDKYYSQLANKYRIGGVVLAKNAPTVLAILESEHEYPSRQSGQRPLSAIAQLIQEASKQQEAEWLASQPEEEVEALPLTPTQQRTHERAERIRAENAARGIDDGEQSDEYLSAKAS